jgi:hypothetical protein
LITQKPRLATTRPCIVELNSQTRFESVIQARRPPLRYSIIYSYSLFSRPTNCGGSLQGLALRRAVHIRRLEAWRGRGVHRRPTKHPRPHACSVSGLRLDVPIVADHMRMFGASKSNSVTRRLKHHPCPVPRHGPQICEIPAGDAKPDVFLLRALTMKRETIIVELRLGQQVAVKRSPCVRLISSFLSSFIYSPAIWRARGHNQDNCSY